MSSSILLAGARHTKVIRVMRYVRFKIYKMYNFVVRFPSRNTPWLADTNNVATITPTLKPTLWEEKDKYMCVNVNKTEKAMKE